VPPALHTQPLAPSAGKQAPWGFWLGPLRTFFLSSGRQQNRSVQARHNTLRSIDSFADLADPGV